MSSLLTNNSAMVALQTLRTINRDMSDVQSEISTGKKIANARDNAAIWGIAKTMGTDISGFKAISESLSLGTATLAVGRDGAETIADLLDQLKGKIVASQEENVDRNKIQRDVDALVEQIGSVADGAQFNGLNLLKGTGEIKVLASLNRTDEKTVESDHIAFERVDISTTKGEVDLSSGFIAAGMFAVTDSEALGDDIDPRVSIDFTGRATGSTLSDNDGGVIPIEINGVTFDSLTIADNEGLDSEAFALRVYNHLAAQTDKLAEANVRLQPMAADSAQINQIDHPVDGTVDQVELSSATALGGRADAAQPHATVTYTAADSNGAQTGDTMGLTINGESFTIDVGSSDIQTAAELGDAVRASFATGTTNGDRLAEMGIAVVAGSTGEVEFRANDGTAAVNIDAVDLGDAAGWTTPATNSAPDNSGGAALARSVTIDNSYYTPEEGNIFSVTLNSGSANDDFTRTFTHVVGADDTAQTILTALKNKIDADSAFGSTATGTGTLATATRVTQNAAGDYQLMIDNDTGNGGPNLTVSMDIRNFGVEDQFMGGSAAAFDVIAIDGTHEVDVDIDVSTTSNVGVGNTDIDPATVPYTAASFTLQFDYEIEEGNAFAVTLRNEESKEYRTFTQVASEGDTGKEIMEGLKAQIDEDGIFGVNGSFPTVTRTARDASDNFVLLVDNDSGDGTLTVTEEATNEGAQAGGLAALRNINVTTDEGARSALDNIEGWIQKSINAAATFGSAQGRISTQTEFVSRVIDGLTSGVGALVDADMEAASARLQALQVQQQLGTQALSIANQQPQNILALFRQ